MVDQVMAADEAAQSSVPDGDAPAAPIAENVLATDDPVTDAPDPRA